MCHSPHTIGISFKGLNFYRKTVKKMLLQNTCKIKFGNNYIFCEPDYKKCKLHGFWVRKFGPETSRQQYLRIPFVYPQFFETVPKRAIFNPEKHGRFLFITIC